MALTLETNARNAANDAVVDLIDAGSFPGKLKIKSALDVVLCIITLSDPAYSDSVLGVATAMGLPLSGIGTAAAGAGTAAAKYDVTDGDDVVVWRGTVPGNMVLDNVNIAENQTVNVTSWAHGQPAS